MKKQEDFLKGEVPPSLASSERFDESVPQKSKNEDTFSKADLEETIEDTKHVYQTAVEEMFDDEDPLKQKILDYFVNRTEVDAEYAHIIDKLPVTEKRNYATSVKESLKDVGTFVNKMERYFARQTVYENERRLTVEPREASVEEYEMGAYFDYLEPQVKDAVISMNKKGYKTFQSGFSESDPKEQFIDVYNRSVSIPAEVEEVLKKYGVSADVENFDDRTTVTLRPIDSSLVIRQETWSEIWNKFADTLPDANSELVPNVKTPTLHRDFRRVQDILRQLKETKDNN